MSTKPPRKPNDPRKMIGFVEVELFGDYCDAKEKPKGKSVKGNCYPRISLLCGQ